MMLPDPKALMEDFRKVSELAGVESPTNTLSFEALPAPHEPPSVLPKGKMAVYVFFCKHRCLKVGKAGPKSQARYTSHHYSVKSSNSNLAKSIVSAHLVPNVSESNVGAWIKASLDRWNFLLDENCGIPTLTLFESVCVHR